MHYYWQNDQTESIAKHSQNTKSMPFNIGICELKEKVAPDLLKS